MKDTKNKTGKVEDSRTKDCESDKDSTDAKKLKPVTPKVGESADNLKQRSDWFQKRTGKS